jgi:hypothetical protein
MLVSSVCQPSSNNAITVVKGEREREGAKSDKKKKKCAIATALLFVVGGGVWLGGWHVCCHLGNIKESGDIALQRRLLLCLSDVEFFF